MSDQYGLSSQKSALIIFAYAPAGLGHLRVADALYHGLPTGQRSLVLTSADHAIGALHRLTSIHPVARAIMEWLQRGKPEDLFTWFYRGLLRSRVRRVAEDIHRLLDACFELPQTVCVVATHFGLAHQLAAVKDEISRTRGIDVKLVVQVTDDSPQHIWYVAGADRIAVPSQRTADALMTYGRAAHFPPTTFTVLPYPVSPILTAPLSSAEFESRRQQLSPKGSLPIQIAIPVSGAAVGLGFSRDLIAALHQLEPRGRFHVVAQATANTRGFLRQMADLSFVMTRTATRPHETVEAYESLYRETVIAFEITKPSEQAFKALIDPARRGGAILLFSQPIGRQEYDNLDFLARHALIPTQAEHDQMLQDAEADKALDPDSLLPDRARSWRGLQVPERPDQAAKLIAWCLRQGILARMTEYSGDDRESPELGIQGVSRFWEMVYGLIRK